MGIRAAFGILAERSMNNSTSIIPKHKYTILCKIIKTNSLSLDFGLALAYPQNMKFFLKKAQRLRPSTVKCFDQLGIIIQN
jgi:hypothetical protein